MGSHLEGPWFAPQLCHKYYFEYFSNEIHNCYVNHKVVKSYDKRYRFTCLKDMPSISLNLEENDVKNIICKCLREFFMKQCFVLSVCSLAIGVVTQKLDNFRSKQNI